MAKVLIVTARVCIPAFPPIDATIGIKTANATTFSISSLKKPITIEAITAVNKLSKSQLNLLLVFFKTSSVISSSPTPIAFVAWEVSVEEQFAIGGLSAPGKLFKGFVTNDLRVINGLIGHLDSVMNQKAAIQDSRAAIESQLRLPINKIMTITQIEDSKSLKDLRSRVTELASGHEAELILFEMSAASYLVTPYPEENRDSWKRVLNENDLNLFGRSAIAKQINEISSAGVSAGVVLPTTHGFKHLTEWGAFIDLNGVDALLHITDISWVRVNKPSELLSIGQNIKVKITKIEPDSKKISVGIKQLTEDPYEKYGNKYKVGETYNAVVTKVLDYGCFAKLEDGLEGLIHQSELSYSKKNNQPGKILTTSQEVKVKILEKDDEKRRLSLSYKATQVNPWKKLLEENPVGSEVEVVVKNITDFALFVTIKDSELDGMIHYKDLSYSEEETELEKYKKKSTLKAKILEINENKEKIRLGVKQLENDPFDFFKDKKKSDVLTVIVKETLKNESTEFILQRNQNGTAHAVIQCKERLKEFQGNILVLSGDVPFITATTLTALINKHIQLNSKELQ